MGVLRASPQWHLCPLTAAGCPSPSCPPRLPVDQATNGVCCANWRRKGSDKYETWGRSGAEGNRGGTGCRRLACERSPSVIKRHGGWTTKRHGAELAPCTPSKKYMGLDWHCAPPQKAFPLRSRKTPLQPGNSELFILVCASPRKGPCGQPEERGALNPGMSAPSRIFCGWLHVHVLGLSR